MRIFLVSISEPLPTDSGTPKLLRAGILFRYLSNQGHELTWWTSSFDHALKQQRCFKDRVDQINDKARIVIMYAPGYKKNMSILRLINHIIIAFKFARYTKHERIPDVIITSYPAIELSFSAVFYAKKLGVPCIVDTRDMWPNVIYDDFNNQLAKIAVKVGLYHMTLMARYIFNNACSIIGITDAFVKWAHSYSNFRDSSLDKSFPLTSRIVIRDKKKMKLASDYWAEFSLTKNNAFVVCFFGVISDRKFDFSSIFKTSEMLMLSGYNIKFVLCGTGDSLNRYRKENKDKNIIFPGWIDAPKILTLMRIADVGLAPYRSSKDFKLSVPIKIFEYMSEGLPMVSCLDGLTNKMIVDNQIGVIYKENDSLSLIKSLVKIIDDNDFRRQCAVRAKNLYNEKYQEGKVFSEMISHIKHVAQGRSLS